MMSELRRSVAARVDYAAGPRSAIAILLRLHLWMPDMCAQTLMIPRSFGSETGRLLYIATEIVASGSQARSAGAQRPQRTWKYVRIASTARPRLRVAQ